MGKPVLNRNTQLLRAPSKTDILPSILLFLAGRGGVMGAFPFGGAFFAACYDKTTAYLGITIMYLSLLSAGAAELAVKHMMSALIFWLFANLYRRSSKAVEAAACGGSLFISGIASMFYTFSGPYDVFILFIESVISGVMYIIFSGSRDVASRYKNPAPLSQDELLSVSAAAGVFILGMGRMIFPYEISLSNIITVYAVLIGALNSSLSGAALIGISIGFITGGADAVIMTGALGLSAMFGGFFKSMGRFGVAVGFMGGACAILLYAQNTASLPYSVFDVIIPAILFAATPGFVHKKFSEFFGPDIHVEESKNAERVRAYFMDRLTKCAESFKSLENVFLEASKKRAKLDFANPEDIFAETAGRVCDGCSRCSRCWDKESDKTVKSMTELYDLMERKGSLNLNSMPLSLRERCLHPEHLLLEFNHVYELFKLKLTSLGDRYAARDITAAQYRETAAIFEDISKDIGTDFEFCTELEEEAVSVFEKHDIMVYEISISESFKSEVYIRLDDNTKILEAQTILSDILGMNMGFDREDNGGLYFVSRPRFSVDTGIKQVSKENGCGDTVRIFGTDKYKLYCIICDGMGTGIRAGTESSLTAGLLQEFLEAGFSIDTAVGMVNSSMCMKTESDFFTTLDLLCIDLMNGVSEFYKIGAAQSLLCRRGNVETVFSAAFPIGIAPITEVLPQHRRLEDGDVLLMASDGITEAGTVRTDWLKNHIKTPFISMQAMAEEISAKAIDRNNGEILDDMSVITIKIMEN